MKTMTRSLQNASIFRRRPNPLSTISRRMIAVYHGWDMFERMHGGPSVVDFDLCGHNDLIRFDSRNEVLSQLRYLEEHIDETSLDGPFLRARVQGSIAFLEAITGIEIPFPEYVRRTLGFHPVAFSEPELKILKEDANRWLGLFGLEMKREDREPFEAQFCIKDPEAIAEGIVGDQRTWLARLSEAGIPVPDELDLALQFVEVDAYWSNWISGGLRSGITLSVNLHPRKKYYLGTPLALCLHEICGHAVQMAIWRDLIAQGDLDAACGLTTVHSPEAFVSEGLAETVSDLLGDADAYPPEFNLHRALQAYTLAVMHNAHLKIYEGMVDAEIISYAEEMLPFSDRRAIVAEIDDRRSNALFRSYQLSYTIAARSIRKLTVKMGRIQKRQFFLQMYTRPFTPAQLIKMGQDLENCS